MSRDLTQTQHRLATDVRELSNRRAALIKQSGEIDIFQHQAIALAEQFGVRQKLFSDLAALRSGRISQIVKSTGQSSSTLNE